MTWLVLAESHTGFGSLMDAKTSGFVMMPKHVRRVHLSCESGFLM